MYIFLYVCMYFIYVMFIALICVCVIYVCMYVNYLYKYVYDICILCMYVYYVCIYLCMYDILYVYTCSLLFIFS